MSRQSRVDEMKKDLSRALDGALEKLQTIWDEIGILERQQRERTDVVMEHLANLLDKMVNEEERLRTNLITSIDAYSEDLLELRKELHLPPHEPPENLTILQLQKSLQQEVKTLKHEKRDRLNKFKELREQDQHLCDVICATPYYIPSDSVPSKEQLQELEKHIETLTSEKERRYNIFQTTKVDIVKLLDDLEQEPNTSFQRDIVCDLEDSFLLSSENMKALKSYHEDLERKQKENFAKACQMRDQLKTLWDRLKIGDEDRMEFNSKYTGFKPSTIQAFKAEIMRFKSIYVKVDKLEQLKAEIARCQELKSQNMKQVIIEARKELIDWWDKCFFSEEQRLLFTHLNDENYTEDLLELHDQQVVKIRTYYEDNKEMLDLVTKRQKLFENFLEFERKAADPNRFFNRGCNLLKEEKARKKLEKELPRVEQDVMEQIDQFEKRHNREFKVGGVRFADYIQNQWENWKVQKENEKQERHQARDKQIKEEIMYGSRPVTPAKRRFAGTPAKSPAPKSRRMNETSKTPKTPGSASHSRLGRTNHTSVFMSHVMGPKSKTPSRSHPAARRALQEKNTGNNDTLFSQTTLSSASAPSVTRNNVTDASLASIGPYHEFAKGLTAKPNSRSSVVPKAAYF